MNEAWNHKMVRSGDFQAQLRVGVLSVCTGRYCAHLERHLGLVLSNFLVGHGKTCYIFTDHVARAREVVSSLSQTHDFAAVVTRIDGRGFPSDTLYRYHYFRMQEQHILTSTDVVFYMDVDLVVEANIRPFEVIPWADKPLVAVRHMLQDARGTPESRPESRAYLADADWRLCYFAGGFLGGRSPEFMSMAQSIAAAIDADDSREVVAIWHDESHLNKYLAVHHGLVRVLSPSYLYPQGYDIPYQPRIAVQKIPHDATRFAQDRFVAPCGVEAKSKSPACSLGPGLGASLFQVAAAIALSAALNEEEGKREAKESEGRQGGFGGFEVLLPLTWCFGDSANLCDDGAAQATPGGRVAPERAKRVSYRGSWLHGFRRHDKFAHLDVRSVDVSALFGLGSSGLDGYSGPRCTGHDRDAVREGAKDGSDLEIGSDGKDHGPHGPEQSEHRAAKGKGGAIVVVGTTQSALAFHPRFQAEVRRRFTLPEALHSSLSQRYNGLFWLADPSSSSLH